MRIFKLIGVALVCLLFAGITMAQDRNSEDNTASQSDSNNAALVNPVPPPVVSAPIDTGTVVAHVGVGREIVVSLSTQTAYAFENGILLKAVLISSGLPSTPTVQGEFSITYKLPSQHLWGWGFDYPDVEWVMYFYKDYAFHSAYWHDNFGEPMSHGCVNMTVEDAAWFYAFAEVGTPVYVQE